MNDPHVVWLKTFSYGYAERPARIETEHLLGFRLLSRQIFMILRLFYDKLVYETRV
jgi:hypothetical protein